MAMNAQVQRPSIGNYRDKEIISIFDDLQRDGGIVQFEDGSRMFMDWMTMSSHPDFTLYHREPRHVVRWNHGMVVHNHRPVATMSGSTTTRIKGDRHDCSANVIAHRSVRKDTRTSVISQLGFGGRQTDQYASLKRLK